MIRFQRREFRFHEHRCFVENRAWEMISPGLVYYVSFGIEHTRTRKRNSCAQEMGAHTRNIGAAQDM